MVNSILQMFVLAAQNVGVWFTTILEATGMEDVYIVFMFVFMITSIIIIPIIGGRLPSPLAMGADSVRKDIRAGKESYIFRYE